jgi:hypothetical protein
VRVRRIASAVSIGVCAVLVLAGCQTKVGAAAFVGSSRISQSDVDDQIVDLKPDAAAAAATTMQVDPAQRIAAVRSFVLTYKLRSLVFTEVLRRNGGVPSQSALTAEHSTAIGLIFGDDTENDETVKTALANIGINPTFTADFVRSWELESLVLTKLNVASDDVLGAALAKMDFDIKVNGRYGSWVGSALALGAPTTPDFLVLAGAAVATTS